MVSRMARALALFLPAFFLLASCGARAQRFPLDAVLDSLGDAHEIRQAAISPDGQRVAWVQSG